MCKEKKIYTTFKAQILTLFRDKHSLPLLGNGGWGGWLEKHQRRADIHVCPQRIRPG